MHTMIKATLTAALIVALAWPLLFWGKSGSSANNGRDIQQRMTQAPFTLERQYEPAW